MTDGSLRSAADRHGEPPPRPAETSAALLGLLDAALHEVALEPTLRAVVRWWAKQFPATRAALGVLLDGAGGGLVATAGDGDLTVVETVPVCILQAGTSWRDVVCRRWGTDVEVAWSPLADGGRIFGGLALAAPVGANAPPLWIDVTARLLAEAVRRETRLRDEKLAALAEFAAGAGHEINNPLGTILGRVQLLSREESHPERRRLLTTIGAQALRVRDMIGDVMLFARPPQPRPEPVRWTDVVEAAVRAFHAEWERRGITLTGERDAAVRISADPAQAAVVISELLRNATHAAPDGSRIEVHIREAAADRASAATLEVIDGGGGLSPMDLRHLFDPFYSGRQAGRGLGFGLSKCWRIVTQHGGCLHAENLHPGVRLIVHWPRA